jgi:hypothetical protein
MKLYLNNHYLVNKYYIQNTSLALNSMNCPIAKLNDMIATPKNKRNRKKRIGYGENCFGPDQRCQARTDKKSQTGIIFACRSTD